MPRHPPCALSSLTVKLTREQRFLHRRLPISDCRLKSLSTLRLESSSTVAFDFESTNLASDNSDSTLNYHPPSSSIHVHSRANLSVHLHSKTCLVCFLSMSLFDCQTTGISDSKFQIQHQEFLFCDLRRSVETSTLRTKPAEMSSTNI